MKTRPVHHLAVCARDLTRAVSFYGGVLGLTELRRWNDAEGRLRSIWLDLGGGAFLAIERAESAGAPRSDDVSGWHCVALGIDPGDRDRWRARLEDAGFPVERESPHSLYVRDPEGALVALSHYPRHAE